MALLIVEILAPIAVFLFLLLFIFGRKKPRTSGAARSAEALCDECAVKAQQDPGNVGNWLSWGATLCDLCNRPKADSNRSVLLAEANEKFAKAMACAGDKAEVLKVWAFSLARASTCFRPPVQMQQLQLATEKMQQALAMRPQNESLPYDWAMILLEVAPLFTGGERVMILQEACTQFAQARQRGLNTPKLCANWAKSLLQLAKMSAAAQRQVFLQEAQALFAGQDRALKGDAELASVYNQICEALGMRTEGAPLVSAADTPSTGGGEGEAAPPANNLFVAGVKSTSFAEENTLGIDEIVHLHERSKKQAAGEEEEETPVVESTSVV